MRFIHLSDLHLGKRLNGFSLMEEQNHILEQILHHTETVAADVVLIAGDIYDKPVPPTEATQAFDGFLRRLSALEIPVCIISGNHDSAERLSFGAELMARSGVHFAPVYEGPRPPVTLQDEFGPVHIHMLPFVKPAHVRRAFPDAEIHSFTDAVRTAVEAMSIDTTQRNLLLTHQFVTGAARCESEELSVGGADNVDAAIFDRFDYVALGHIHGPQNIGRDSLRYCGTPLKYSFSEVGHRKSVTVVELGKKGLVTVGALPLTPLRDLRELRGSYMELTARENYAGTATEDYLHITLTDEEDIPDAMGKLRSIYPNLMKLDYDNARTRAGGVIPAAETERRSPAELFAELYTLQNGQPLSTEQAEFTAALMEKIWEGDA